MSVLSAMSVLSGGRAATAAALFLAAAVPAMAGLRLATPAGPSLPSAHPWLELGLASPAGSARFQLSGWVDLDLADSERGYWKSWRSLPPEPAPDPDDIGRAKDVLRRHYALNEIYLVYHRQFEPATARQAFARWKNAPIANDTAPYVVPALVLQDYGSGGCNFSDAELSDLVAWLRLHVNPAAIAVYEVFDASHDPARDYCGQLDLIRSVHGGALIRLGLQPGEPLDARFAVGVEDTYGAVSSGNTNDRWAAGCGYDGRPSGRDALAGWVDERVGRERVVWDLVAVGFDYGLKGGCGADGFLDNAAVPAGRNPLAHDLMVSRYPGGGADPTWAGFSIDLKIVGTHSLYRDALEDSLYARLGRGLAYGGYFAASLEEVRALFSRYNVIGPPTPPAAIKLPIHGPDPHD